MFYFKSVISGELLFCELNAFIKIQKYPGKQMGGSPQFLNWPRTDHQTNTQNECLHVYWRLLDLACVAGAWK